MKLKESPQGRIVNRERTKGLCNASPTTDETPVRLLPEVIERFDRKVFVGGVGWQSAVADARFLWCRGLGTERGGAAGELPGAPGERTNDATW